MTDETLAERLGRRHLSFAKLLGRRKTGTAKVGIAASTLAASSIGGQHLVWMLADLIARQFGVVAKIDLALPAVPVFNECALFDTAERLLPSAIERSLRGVAAGALEVERVNRLDGSLDFAVIVGHDPSQAPSARNRLGVLADGWAIFAGRPEDVPAHQPISRYPVGSYFAACIAAGEVFKRLHQMNEGRGRFVERLEMSLWDYSTGNWSDLPRGLIGSEVAKVPALYLVGAGAVGEAVAAVLGTSPMVGHCTTIDPDKIDDEGTNLNRHILANINDLREWKADIVDRFLSRRGFSVHAFHGTWEQYVTGTSRGRQRADVASSEARMRYDVVLSCVDKNNPRRAIQNVWPRVLFGGSTLDLGMLVAGYDMNSPYECLMCSNPPDDDVPSIDAIADELRRMSPEERAAVLHERNVDRAAIEEYLNRPRCDSLGERELRKFGESSRAALPSVGFVSVASGVVLASEFIKFAANGTLCLPSEKGSALRFSFLNPVSRWWAKHLRRAECDCVERGAAAFRNLWSESNRTS